MRKLAAEEATAPSEPAVVGCWVSPGWSTGLTIDGHSDWPDVTLPGVSTSRNDIETTSTGEISCPVCGVAFTRSRRQRYCSPACRQAAWRARHPAPQTTTAPVVPARPRRSITVYACTECEQRYYGEQWCPNCQRPCRRVDTGGLRPHCDEPVAITDLLDQHLPSSTNRA